MMNRMRRNYALILALGLMLTGCTGQTGTDETKATQTQQIATSGTEETVEPSPSADITTVDVQTTENKTEEDTTAVKETTDQETESEEESTAEETTAEEPTAEESEEPTAEEETTPETTAEPTTAEPTTPEPTTAEPTTPEPTTPEPTTPEPVTAPPTKPEPTTEPTTAEPETTTPIVVIKAVKIDGSVNGTHYIGDTLSGADFTIKVTMSDGNVLTNPAGWAAAPLTLSAATNVITIAYGDVNNQITVNASEKPATQPTVSTSDNLGSSYSGEEMLAYAYQTFIYGHCEKIFAREMFMYSNNDTYKYGSPYVCSTFVQAVFAKFGMTVPSNLNAMYNLDKTSANVTEVPWEEAREGDLAVVLYTGGTSPYTGHCGIVIGVQTDASYMGVQVIDCRPDNNGVGTALMVKDTGVKVLRFSGNNFNRKLTWNSNNDLPVFETVVGYKHHPEGEIYTVTRYTLGQMVTDKRKYDRSKCYSWYISGYDNSLAISQIVDNNTEIDPGYSQPITVKEYKNYEDIDGSQIEPGEYSTVYLTQTYDNGHLGEEEIIGFVYNF